MPVGHTNWITVLLKINNRNLEYNPQAMQLVWLHVIANNILTRLFLQVTALILYVHQAEQAVATVLLSTTETFPLWEQG